MKTTIYSFLFLAGFFISCSTKNINCRKINKDTKACKCENSKELELDFQNEDLIRCFIKTPTTFYEIHLIKGTSKIAFVKIFNEDASAYDLLSYKNGGVKIKRYNTSLNEILRLKRNEHGGFDYTVSYALDNLKIEKVIYNFSTDSLNEMLPGYLYYEYDSDKKEYKLVSDMIMEGNANGDLDSSVFIYSKGIDLKKINFTRDDSNRVYSFKNRELLNNYLINGVLVKHGKSPIISGEYYVYFQSDGKTLSNHILLFFNGDLKSRVASYIADYQRLADGNKSNDIGDKEDLMKELYKFGISVKNGKLYLSSSLKEELNR